MLEVQLLYRTCGTADGGSVPVARVDDPAVIRGVVRHVLDAAEREVQTWEAIDTGVAAIRRADANRLIALVGGVADRRGKRRRP